MPATTYSYTVAVDFPSGLAVDKLERKIIADIATMLNELKRKGDNVSFTFAAQLPGGQKNTLDGDTAQAEKHPPAAGSVLGDHDGVYNPIKKIVTGTVDPGATDDIDAGCDVGTLWVNTTTNQVSICADSTAGAAVWDKHADYLDWMEDEFSPTNGQVSFALSQAPQDPDSLTLLVNGVVADDGDDYTLSGTNLTWLDNLFVLDTGDKLLARYI